jgi:hypothetical protein
LAPGSGGEVDVLDRLSGGAADLPQGSEERCAVQPRVAAAFVSR